MVNAAMALLVLVSAAKAQTTPFYTAPADNTRVAPRPCPNCHDGPSLPKREDDWSWAAQPAQPGYHHKTPEKPFDFSRYYTAPADNTRVVLDYLQQLPPQKQEPAAVPEKKAAAPVPQKKAAPAKKKAAAPKKSAPAAQPEKKKTTASEQLEQTAAPTQAGEIFDGGAPLIDDPDLMPVSARSAGKPTAVAGTAYPKPALTSVKADTKLAEPASPAKEGGSAEKKPGFWTSEKKGIAVMAGVGAAWGVAIGAIAGGPLAIVGFALLGAVMFGGLGWAASKKKG